MTRKTAFLVVCALSFVACGDGAESGAGAAQAADASIKPIEREPMTDADFAGLARENLVVEVPWMTNRVNRSPVANAARALVRSVAVEEHEGFERVIFTFGEGVDFPGYSVEFAQPDSVMLCGEEPESTELAGAAVLLVRIRPARNSDEGRTTVRPGTSAVQQTRIREAGMSCAENDVVAWVAGLESSQAVRVLEMRSPQRLVVDVR